MSVSRSRAPSSIDLSGVPARVAEAVAQVVAVCHEQFRPDPLSRGVRGGGVAGA